MLFDIDTFYAIKSTKKTKKNTFYRKFKLPFFINQLIIERQGSKNQQNCVKNETEMRFNVAVKLNAQKVFARDIYEKSASKNKISLTYFTFPFTIHTVYVNQWKITLGEPYIFCIGVWMFCICDGHNIFAEFRSKIRVLAISKFPNINQSNRRHYSCV